MKNKSKGINRIWLLLIYLALVLGLFIFVIRSKNTVEGNMLLKNLPTISEAMAEGGYDNGIVFSGLYIIDIRGISDDVISKAVESANDSNQLKMYYCSELSGGNWYEIDEFSVLESITPLGESISITEIEVTNPYVKYYVDKDGEVFDLTKKGNTPVSLWDYPDPYNKYLLGDFSELLNHINSDAISGSLANDITAFYDLWPKDEYTNKRDSFLSLAQNYKIAKNDEGSEEAKELVNTMQSIEEIVDAERRYHYYENVLGIPIKLEEEMTLDSKLYKAGASYKGGFAYLESKEIEKNLDAKTKEKISKTKYFVEDGMTVYAETMLSEPDNNSTTLEIELYKAYESVVNDVLAKENNSIITKDLIRFKHLYNIKNETVVDSAAERELVKELIATVTEKYIGLLDDGVTPNYTTGLAQNESLTALEQTLYDQLADIENVRLELQFLISAYLIRTEDENEQQEYILERIKITTDFYNSVVDDEFFDYANSSIAAHLEWLRAMLKKSEVESDISADDQELNEATKETTPDITDEYDYDDPTEITTEIILYNHYLGQGGSSDDSNEDENKAKAKAKLSELLAELANDAAEDIKAGKSNSGALFTLVSLGANAALEELSDNFSEDETFKEAMDAAGRMLSKKRRTDALSKKVADYKKSTSDGGDGDGNDKDGSDKHSYGDFDSNADDGDYDYETDREGLSDDAPDKLKKLASDDNKKQLSENDIDKIIEKNLGDSWDNLSVSGKIIAAVATGELGDAGIDAARSISQKIMKSCIEEDNKYAYKTLIKNDLEFVSLRTIERISDFRYAYDDKKTTATMENVGEGAAYVYTLGSDRVQIYEGKTEKMDSEPIVKDGFAYSVESDTLLRYDVAAYPVSTTGYSGALTTKMSVKKDHLIEALVEAATATNEE